MNYFTMGYWVLALMFSVSAAGAVVGLACIRQSTLSVTARFRMVWLTAAAVCIGAVGAWLAVYVSLLGVGVSSGDIRYDVTRLIVAAVIAAAAVLAGLVITGRERTPARILGGGGVMGLGIGVMHRLAMGAIRVQGSVDVHIWTSLAAGVLAIAASAGLIWATTRYRSMITLTGIAMVYALLINAVHYLGQAGVDVQLDTAISHVPGADLFSLFVPVAVLSTLSLAIPITAVLVAPDRIGTTRSRQQARSRAADATDSTVPRPGATRSGADRTATRPQPVS